MMSRTQITLDPEAHRQARARAERLGLSLAAYIRMVVQRDLDGVDQGMPDVEGIIDLGDSRESDVARNKDAYLQEAMAAVHPARGRERA